MLDAYGRAVVEERHNPRRHAELASFVRWEYGRGTGVGFLLAEMAAGAPPRGKEPTLALVRAYRALRRALGTPFRVPKGDEEETPAPAR